MLAIIEAIANDPVAFAAAIWVVGCFACVAARIKD
jgi:hypothetical protein